MKGQAEAGNRHERLRAHALRQLAMVAPFLEGTLCQVKRPGCTKPGWQVTFKQKGKTRTVYVPMDLAAEVKTWASEYKRVRKLIRKVTQHSLGLIRGHVANRSAARRSRALRPPAVPKRS